MVTPRIAVSIDIGTAKVCTLVVEHGADGAARLLGSGIARSRGVSKGAIVEVQAAAAAVADSVAMAENDSGYTIGSATLGLSGGRTYGLRSSGWVNLSPGAPIGRREIERASESARDAALPPGKEILHVLPLNYSIDGGSPVKDPTGMSGLRLDLDAHVVAVDGDALQSALDVLESVGVKPDVIVLQPLASAYAVLTREEREHGVVLVEIGGGTTDVAVFIEGAVCHTIAIPLGGASITNDLAVVLEVSTEVGERLKLGDDAAPGASFPMNAGRRLDEVEYDQDAEDDGDYIFMDFKLAREVVDARVKEIFTMIQTDLRRSGYDEMIAAGVVLTGGGSRLNGLQERVSEILGTPVRVGAPTGLTGRGQVVHSPEYAAAVGLTMWSSGPPSVPVRDIQESPETRGVVLRAAGWFREFLLP